MSRHDWYRNEEWNEEIASAFEAKLRRARDKEQYLRIQACMLTESHPEIAHALLDRFFKLPNQFDAAQAHVDRAEALLAQGKVLEAIAAYELALAREREFPRLLTQAYVELPFLIASHDLSELFPKAEALLNEYSSRPRFPTEVFKWNAAQAIIARFKNDRGRSIVFSASALEAASKEELGLHHHPKVGLVPHDLAGVVQRMHALLQDA